MRVLADLAHRVGETGGEKLALRISQLSLARGTFAASFEVVLRESLEFFVVFCQEDVKTAALVTRSADVM